MRSLSSRLRRWLNTRSQCGPSHRARTRRSASTPTPPVLDGATGSDAEGRCGLTDEQPSTDSASRIPTTRGHRPARPHLGVRHAGRQQPEIDQWSPTDDEVLGAAVLNVPAVGEAVMILRQGDHHATVPVPVGRLRVPRHCAQGQHQADADVGTRRGCRRHHAELIDNSGAALMARIGTDRSPVSLVTRWPGRGTA